MQQVYSISPLSFICPRDKSVKHISTISYTLTGGKYQENTERRPGNGYAERSRRGKCIKGKMGDGEIAERSI